MTETDIKKIVNDVIKSLPKANPNRVREVGDIEEKNIDALRNLLNSSTPTANYEVRFIFSDLDKTYGIAHIRRLE